MIINLQNENWKDVPGYEGRYQVSNKGRIKRIYREEILMSTCADKNGYMKVALSKYIDNTLVQKTHMIHRIVGFVFVPGYKQGLEINHKDGNKANNDASNLEWVTRSENMLHAVANGLTKYETGPRVYNFCQFDKKGNLIRKWGSINDCAYLLSLQTGYDEKIIKGNLMACLRNKTKSCCGYLFSFTNTIDWQSKEKDLGQIPVVATIVTGIRGHRTISDKPEDTIIFRSVNETEGYVMPNGKKVSATNVSKCCRGLRDTHAGYKWRYENSDFIVKDTKLIYQYDKDWNLIKIWDCGVNEVASQLGLANNSGISRCLHDKTETSTCLGFYWKYDKKKAQV